MTLAATRASSSPASLLVIGVLVYNGWQERRAEARRHAPPVARSGPAADACIRARRADTCARAPSDARMADERARVSRGARWRERLRASARRRSAAAMDAPAEAALAVDAPPCGFAGGRALPVTASTLHADPRAVGARQAASPILRSNASIPLQPAAAGRSRRACRRSACAARQAAALVRPRRCALPWQRLTSDTPGEFAEIAACLLLADRNGAASRAQLDTFVRVVGEHRAARCPRRCHAPDVAQRSGARRNARSPVRRARRADRHDSAEADAGDDRRHASARRGRGGGLSARRRRPLRMDPGGNRRRPLHAAESARRAVHARTRCA